ncbi:MAG: Sporulation kinase E [Pelotomaculum sp. PtaB.Bin104]|nr:MAG: Sporulation kinase E [Pelotomaculum sp. PtaB.Bin104]
MSARDKETINNNPGDLCKPEEEYEAKGASRWHDGNSQQEKPVLQPHLLSCIHEAIAVMDENYTITYWNELAEKIYGWSAAEAVGRNAAGLLHTEVQGSSLNASLARMLEDNYYEGDVVNYHKDGRAIPIEVHAQVIRNERGEFKGAVATFRDITKRKRAEAAIEGKFLGLAEVSPAGIALYRGERLLYVNPAVACIFGYTCTELLNMNFLCLVHPAYRNMVKGMVKARMAGRQKLARYEVKIITKSGEEKWLDISSSLIAYQEQRTGMFICTDIVEHKRREGNLAFLAGITEDFARFSSVKEIMDSVSARVGKYLNITHCLFSKINEAQDKVIREYAWCAQDQPDICGEFRLSEFVNETFRQAARAGETIVVCNTQSDPRTGAGSLATHDIHAFVSVPFHRDGQWKYLFSVNTTETRDWREDEIQLIQEITNRTFLRLERARAEDALRESEEKYRKIVETSSEGILWTDAQSRIYYANKIIAEWLGYGVEELVGRLTFDFVFQEDLEESIVHFKKRQAGFSEKYDFKLRKKDGSHIWVIFSGAPLQDKDGNYIGTLIMFTDITERKRTEAALRESEDEPWP